MKVALLGASGFVGKEILKELVDRGHTVTAIVRSPEKVSKSEGVIAQKGDITKPAELIPLLQGHDAVISSVKFQEFDPSKFIQTAKEAKVKRLLVVGGAGSLEISPGVRLIDAPAFPDAYKPEASAGAKFLELLRQEKQLDWTFLSPSAIFFPGEKTREFRLGADQLLSNARGDSKISTADYSIALVDELEKPAHSRQRFTVGY